MRRLIERFIVWRYIAAGVTWGDATSYLHSMGTCVGYDKLTKRLQKWERLYNALGYAPITSDDWIRIGGWGKDVEPLLYQRGTARH
jgi:hypothetical protein